MQDHRSSSPLRSRWIAYVSAVAAMALGAMTAVALAQQETTPTTPTTTTEQQQPEIPEGFSEEDCDFTEQPDGTTVVTCSREERSSRTERESRSESGEASAEVRGEASAEETVAEDIVPVGGTGAGAGGTASGEDATLPFAIGIGGLLLALTAAALVRRRRLD